MFVIFFIFLFLFLFWRLFLLQDTVYILLDCIILLYFLFQLPVLLIQLVFAAGQA